MFLSVVLPFSSRFWLLAFCFGCFFVSFSAQKQPKQNASSQNREENGSTTLKKHKGKASASRVKSSSSYMLKKQGYTERRNNHGKCDNFLPTKPATE